MIPTLVCTPIQYPLLFKVNLNKDSNYRDNQPRSRSVKTIQLVPGRSSPSQRFITGIFAAILSPLCSP